MPTDPAFVPVSPDDSNNFLRSSRAVLTLGNIHKFDLYCTEFQLPGVSVAQASVENLFLKLNFRGDKLEYDEFEATFLVREDLTNWLVIYNWMVGMAPPHEFAESIDRTLTYVDASLVIFNSNNTPRMKVTLTNLFPVNLGSIQFSSQDDETNVKSTNIRFVYDSMEIVNL